MQKIISFENAKQLGVFLNEQNKKVVLTGGCFDLLHLGHITLLQEAKKQGDTLVVLLESDKRIEKLKGSNRPLHTQKQRSEILSAIKAVDYILCLPNEMNNEMYDSVVKLIQPAIIATTEESDTVKYITKQAESVGATVYLVKQIENLSTSRILDVVAKEL